MASARKVLPITTIRQRGTTCLISVPIGGSTLRVIVGLSESTHLYRTRSINCTYERNSFHLACTSRRDMYCPVYGCNSDSKKQTNPPTHFFNFPSGTSTTQKQRRKVWIEFCKRKAFKPSSSTRICSLHFEEDAYEPGGSLQFLARLGYGEKFIARLKKDAVPTINTAIEEVATENIRGASMRRQREKVLFVCAKYSYFVSPGVITL